MVVIPDGEFQAVLNWRLAGQADDSSVTIGVRNEPTGTIADPNTVAEIVANVAVSSGLCAAANMSNSWTFTGVNAYLQDGALRIPGSAPRSIAGTGGWSAPPVNCAMLVTKVVAGAGRRNRGRWYLPPFCVDEATTTPNGVLSSTILGQMITRLEAFRNGFNPSDLELTLLHSDGGPSSYIATLRPEALLATQRRRMRR